MNDRDQSGTIDALLNEIRVFRPLPKVLVDANVSPVQWEMARAQSAEDHLAYWEDAAEELDWFGKWHTVLDESTPPFYKWFLGAKCNIVYNALDRHIDSPNKNKLALIWEGEAGDCRKYTYFELYREVNKLANALMAMGIERGDRVVLYMPPLPETAIAMLATAKIGAVHSLVFAGYSARALRERIDDLGARLVITADGFYRDGRVINLKAIVDDALECPQEDRPVCDSVEKVVVVNRANAAVRMGARDVWYEDAMRGQRPVAPTAVMDAEDMLFVLYTSGATGRPKGIVHSHGGYMVGVHRTMHWIFDIKPTDIFWCTADPGWITGHSYGVYGPLLAGTTSVMYEGHPLYPKADRVWSMVERYGVSILYTTPTLVRMLMRFGDNLPREHDIASLRLLGTVGEPISPEAWIWLHKHVGRSECPILDTWWQTETGMCMLSPMPFSLLKPGSVNKPLCGIEADVVDGDGNSVPPDRGGLLVVKKPWPAMCRTVFNDPDRYERDYWSTFPGMFLAGDVARKDEDGYFWIQGRADDVMVIAGHRVGTAEFEAALVAHSDVAEAAVIPVPDAIRGSVAKAFVVLNDESVPREGLVDELVEHLRTELGPVAVLGDVAFRSSLPKTRSGKILRRMLRAEELGEEPGDLSALLDHEQDEDD